MPGITYDIGDLEQLAEDIGVWSTKHFGHTLPTHSPRPWSLLRASAGMTEEIGELLEQLNFTYQKDLAEIEDALADICVYALDFMYKNEMTVQDTLLHDKEPCQWESAYIKTIPQGEAVVGVLASGLVIFNARLAHHTLKSSQRIRKHENHQEGMRLNMCHVWRLCYRIAKHYDRDLNQLVKKVAEKVLKRDWTKNPETAHEDKG